MKSESSASEHYFEGTGSRKTAVARVRIVPAKEKSFSINGKKLEAYFQDLETRKICEEAFEKGTPGVFFAASIKVAGGGLNSQAEAIRHGIARALLVWNPELKSILKKFGYVKRDPRMRERKKFGLRRARRARQWRKR